MGHESNRPGSRNKLIWTLVSAGIAVASIWAVLDQCRGFSLRELCRAMAGASWGWLLAAAAGAAGFVIFEAAALRHICAALGMPHRLRNGCVYAAADIYFSAITPSGTGGQPASAYLMLRDGLPAAAVTAALLLNLTMYSFATVAIGAACLLGSPGVLACFGAPSRVLIAAGVAVQLGFALFLLLMLRKGRLLYRLCEGGLRLLERLHLLRRTDRRHRKLRTLMEDYQRCAELFAGRGRSLFWVFVCNVLQRLSQISVTVFVYLALGGGALRPLEVLAVQSCVVLGSNSVPIPGAMGVADYLMLDSFGTFLPEPQAVGLELLSRAISFYGCVLLCGLTTLLWMLRLRKREREEHA